MEVSDPDDVLAWAIAAMRRCDALEAELKRRGYWMSKALEAQKALRDAEIDNTALRDLVSTLKDADAWADRWRDASYASLVEEIGRLKRAILQKAPDVSGFEFVAVEDTMHAAVKAFNSVYVLGEDHYGYACAVNEGSPELLQARAHLEEAREAYFALRAQLSMTSKEVKHG